jgi:hypothetical protein
MRGKDDVRKLEQPRRHVRLVGEDVEGRSDPAGDELLDECLLIHDRTARAVLTRQAPSLQEAEPAFVQ